jgi:exonuclease SbcD
MVALPFLSQRYAIRATEMFDLSAAEATQTYADHVGRLLATLSEGFGPDTVNLVTAHLTVIGGTMGGGERDAHTIQAYAVPATVFSPGTHYVALGHLHRAQSVLAPCPVHYSGSPLAVDFGEEENAPSVTMVEVGAQSAARITQVPVTAAVPLRTVRGTLDELAKVTASDGWLRVYVRERPRAGLREAVQELLPQALEVRIDPSLVAEMAAADSSTQARRTGRAPGELFSDYLRSRGHSDPAVSQLFDRLYGEVRAS